MLISYVVGAIKVGIESIATLTAFEKRLGATIRPMLIATFATRLRGVTRVNSLDANPTFLRLVDGEIIQLRKGPAMQTTPGIVLRGSTYLRGFPNVGQVLEDNRCSGLGVLYYSLTQYVVCVPVESGLLFAQLFQVFLGRLGSVGLQFPTYAEVATVNLFPMFAPQELTFRGDCGSIQTQVNSNDLSSFRNNGFRHINNHMQPELPFAVNQVGSGNLVACVLLTEMRHRKGEGQTTSTTRETNLLSLPVERVGFLIVADWTGCGVRALHRCEGRRRLASFERLCHLLGITLFVLLLPRKSTLQGFGGLDTGLNEQITDQSWASRFGLIVGAMMQFHTVLLALLPS